MYNHAKNVASSQKTYSLLHHYYTQGRNIDLHAYCMVKATPFTRVLDLTAPPYTSLKGWQMRLDMINMIHRDTQMAW